MKELRATVKKFLAAELVSQVEELEQNGEFGVSVFKKLGQLGLAAPMLPEPYGIGNLMAQSIVAEEMGYVSSGFGLSVLASICLFGSNIARQGTEEQKRKYLSSIACGEKIGCWALTEPLAGSDAISIQTRAVRQGDTYIINGSKTFITNAPIADYFILMARESGHGFEGATALILERGMTGLKTGQPLEKLGHHSSPTGEIFLENVCVPVSQVLGTPGQAFLGMKLSLDVERAIFSGLGIGMMQFCLETMVNYAQQRKQFGVSILEHQLIQEKIAELSASLDMVRQYSYYVIEKISRGEPANKEAAILKMMGSRAAFQAAQDAVQCLGGYGYMREYKVERCLRDAKLFDVGGGTTEIQKMIIAKQTIREVLAHA